MHSRRSLMLILFVFIFAFALPLSAQSGFTNVTAQVLDPSGNIYANCSYNVDFIGQATGSSQPYRIGGTSPFQQSFGGAKCDSAGNLAIRIADNLLVTPTPSQWQFSICNSTGITCFTTILTITGNNQSITANLQAASVVLGTVAPITLSYRVMGVGSGLQIPSTATINMDAFNGGVNDILTTKTQFQAIRFRTTGRTIGERKGIQGFADCYGKGDCIGTYALAFDSGGYLTGGDEGTHGLDGWAMQGSEDATSTDGGFPRGTVTGVSGDIVTVAWTGGTNAHLGSQRPLINTSRGVVNAGTVSGITGFPCIATGAGTTWASLGSGAHNGDIFLNVTGNDYTTVKHVVPISNIDADNIHATVDYQLAELGATCYGAGMTTTGAYNIYKGGTIQSLIDAGVNVDPVSVVLNSGQGANFQIGDSVQSPLGYNFHGGGVQAIVSRLIGEVQGSGFYASNVSPGSQKFRDAFRASGSFQNGLSFDGQPLTMGVLFTQPVSDSMLRQSDITLATQGVIGIDNSGHTVRRLTYDRTNDWWQWSGNQFLSATDQRIGIGTSPQPSTLAYYFWNNANWKGPIIAPNTPATSNAVPYFGVQLSGVPLLQVEKDRTVINNGMDLKMFSDNETTQKFAVAGATGNITTPGTLNLNGTGALSTTATNGSGSICLTTNCVMTTPNIGAASAASVNATGAIVGSSVGATAAMSFGTTFTGPKMIASGYISGAVSTNNSVSGSPNIDLDTANTFFLTLTGNVTNATWSGGSIGSQVNLIICQDATGSRTWAWNFGTTVNGFDTIGSTASKCNSQIFIRTGAGVLTAISSMKTNF
jgi:hypothetical protein